MLVVVIGGVGMMGCGDSVAIRRGSRPPSISELNDFVRSHPNDAKAYLSLSIAHSENGDFDKALEVCDKAIMLKPDYALAYYCKAGNYNSLGRYQEAVSACNKSVDLDPAFAFAPYRLGESFYLLGQYKESIASCKKSIELDPNFARVHFILGNNYAALGNVNDAIESYKHAIRLESNFIAEEKKYLIDGKNLQESYIATTYYDIGMLHFLLGDKESAMDTCETLKTIDKSMADKLLHIINK
jgi:tetratricopeptide (TPR) repeat protein